MTSPIADLLSIATSPSTTTIPDIGFVVKTIDENGRKVFINICSSDAIPFPPLWPQNNNNNTDQLPPEITSCLKPTKSPPPSSLLSSSTTPTTPSSPSKSLTLTPHLKQLLDIPFQLTPHPRLELDKSGQHHCTVTECVFNTNILQHHAANYRPLKMYIIQLALGAVERQVGVQLNMTEFKLPKMRYKGSAPPPMNFVIREKEKDVLLMEGEGSREEEEEEPRIVMQKKKTAKGSQRVPNSSKVLVEEVVAAAAALSSVSTTTTFKKPKIEFIARPVEEVKLHIEVPNIYNANFDDTIVVVVAVCRENIKIGALKNDHDHQSKEEEGRSTLDSGVEVKVLSPTSSTCPVFSPGAVEMSLPFAVTTRGAGCVVGVGEERGGGKKRGIVTVTLKVVPLKMLLDLLPKSTILR